MRSDVFIVVIGKNLPWEKVSWVIRELFFRIGWPFMLVREGTPVPNPESALGYGVESNGKYPVLPSLWNHANQDQDQDPISDSYRWLDLKNEAGALDKLNRVTKDTFVNTAHLLVEPRVEINAKRLEETIRSLFPHKRLPAPQKWSEKEITVCITHDVDGPFLLEVRTALNMLRRTMWPCKTYPAKWFYSILMAPFMLQRDPYMNIEGWVQIAEDLAGSSTLFVFPGRIGRSKHWRDPRYSISTNIFKQELVDAFSSGNEIALHCGITRHENYFRRASDKLTNTLGLGGRVIGNRAHYWSVPKGDESEYQKELGDAGFLYDASYSIQGVGYRNGSCLPSRSPYHASLHSVSTPLMDHYVVNSMKEGSNDTADLVRSTARNNGMLVMDWHVRTLSNSFAWAGYFDAFANVIELILQHNVRFMTLSSAVREWSEHCANLEYQAT